MTEHEIIADWVAAHLRDYMKALHSEAGLPWDAILVGCHTGIVMEMAMQLGGPIAAQICGQAAASVGHLPDADGVALALAAPAGRA